MRLFCRATLLLGLALSAVAAAADDYWGYTYRNIDVTAAGTNAYAVNLARYCVRFDALLSRIFGLKGPARPRVHIYALPSAQLAQFIDADGVSYRTGDYENFIVLPVAAQAGDYWGAYFGYTAILVRSDPALRGGPDWYRLGLPLVFASSTFEHGRARLGTVNVGYAVTLGQGSSYIPMRRFLTGSERELIADSTPGRRLYEAEAWGLAHEVFLEGLHRAEFESYLQKVREGRGAGEAFTASFKISYEQLDKEFADAVHRRPNVYSLEAPEDPAASRELAQPLAPAEIKGRLALLSVRYRHGPDPVQLASEALQLDSTNQTALRALALAHTARGAWAEALAAADRLCTASAAAETYPDCAEMFARLAHASTAGEAKLPVDAARLSERARENYQRVLAVNPEDRRARDALARLGAPAVDTGAR